jgi:hypothetical protein
MKVPSACLALALLVGCANSPTASVEGGDSDVVCERYYPTGSNLPKTRCVTAEERRKDQEGVDDVRNAINRGNRPIGAPGQ